MALISGTATRYDMQGLRESLHDTIYNIDPEDTPFMSGMGRGPKASQTLEEWQTDTLATPDGDNAFMEGDDATFETPAATVRVGNYCQISRKTLILSDTLEEVDKAGRRSELAYQLAKRGSELKLDQETIFLQAQGADAGSVGAARKLAALGAWLKTNTSFGSGGADPTYTSGVPSAARTDGTQRPFTETIAKAVIQSGYSNGAKFRTLMVGPFNKTVVSGFAGIATRNFDLSNVSPRPTAIIASADVFVSDFGTLRVIPNRLQRERDAWFIDWDMVEAMYLRGHRTKKLAPTGDAEKRMMIVEYTMKCRNEAGLGGAFDLDAS